jgi:hypothetical protein
MKAGFENRRNVVVLVVLLAVLIPSAWYFVVKVFGGGSPPPAAPAAAAPAARATEAQGQGENGHAAKKVISLESLDPTLHPELMAGAESLEYSGDGRNIFSMSSAPVKIEQPKGPVRPTQQEVAAAAVPAGPPPPPPIDLTFFGYEADGGRRKAFLLHGDDVFIASEGDVVDHHYKVVKISPLSIEITDLLYNNTQTLNLAEKQGV